MEINLLLKYLNNGDGIYYRISLKHLPEDIQAAILKKSKTGHVFGELETGKIIHGTWDK